MQEDEGMESEKKITASQEERDMSPFSHPHGKQEGRGEERKSLSGCIHGLRGSGNQGSSGSSVTHPKEWRIKEKRNSGRRWSKENGTDYVITIRDTIPESKSHSLPAD